MLYNRRLLNTNKITFIPFFFFFIISYIFLYTLNKVTSFNLTDKKKENISFYFLVLFNFLYPAFTIHPTDFKLK